MSGGRPGGDGVAGPYDPSDVAEEDLWFLPDSLEDISPSDPPWPVAERNALLRADDWIRAEKQSACALLGAATAFVRLDERLNGLRDGAELADRLALHEASDMSWSCGARVTPDRLALYDVMRLTHAGDDRDLATALWVRQRLTRRVGPEAGLVDFLGRKTQSESGLADYARRPEGEEFIALAADWSGLQDAAPDIHPITRAALAFFGWRALGLSGQETDLEAATVAARIGAAEGRALAFLPLAMGGGRALHASGSISERLTSWYRGIEAASLRALMLLDGMRRWEVDALSRTATLSGRTPPALISALRATPALSAEMAARLTGSSRAAALRNLTWFEENGLVREITGQGRFRIWAAKF